MEKLLTLILVFVKFSAVVSLTDPSVVIIGAGPAGIAAATKLLENNIKNIIILEAESRIGGRINTVKFGGTYVDLGAEWCHGQTDNVVYDLVKDFNILRHTNFTTKLYHSSRRDIDDDLSNELFNILFSVYMDEEVERSENATLGEYCVERIKQKIHEKFKGDTAKIALALSAMDLYEQFVLALEGAFSWFDTVATSDYKECSGDQNLNWNGLGYKTILEVLMKKYPDPKNQIPIDDKIFLDKEVTRIDWNSTTSSKGIKVSCSDQSIYTADHVIFTPSLGVLKAKGANLFSPTLPAIKMEAIQNIGFGAVMKIMMKFPKRWWHNSTGFNFLWSDHDKMKAMDEFTEGTNLNGKSWVTFLYSLGTMEYNPNVLSGWITGSMVPSIELLPDETIKNGIFYVLNKFLGDKYEIVKPDAILRSKWYSNPHFKGTYSYQTLKSKMSNNKSAEEVLSMPVRNFEDRPILQFAGEATHPYHYATVHGAIETGYREADRLINLYNKKV